MMTNPIVLFSILAVALYGWYRARRTPADQEQSWEAVADRMGLDYVELDGDTGPRIEGRYRGRSVQVKVRVHEDLLSKLRLAVALRIYPRRLLETTVVAAQTGLDCLDGDFTIRSRRIRDLPGRWLTGGYPGVGNEMFDAHFWVTGQLDDRARGCLQQPEVFQALQAMDKPLRQVVIEQGRVRIESGGIVTSQEELRQRLEQVVDAAGVLDEAAR